MYEILKYLNEAGAWDLLNTVILICGFLYGITLLHTYKQRIKDLNFYVTWRRDTQARFPLILHFEVRNLSQNLIVISSPYFLFDKVKPGPYAHCDSVTGQYEVKFRRQEEQATSEVASMLRHREQVTSYIPLDEKQTDEELATLSQQQRVGTLYCDIVFLESKPRVVRLKLKLKGLVRDKSAEYPRSINVGNTL